MLTHRTKALGVLYKPIPWFPGEGSPAQNRDSVLVLASPWSHRPKCAQLKIQSRQKAKQSSLVILVGPSTPGEGKTLLSVNLAFVLAKSKRNLLLDAKSEIALLSPLLPTLFFFFPELFFGPVMTLSTAPPSIKQADHSSRCLPPPQKAKPIDRQRVLPLTGRWTPETRND